MHPTSPFGNFPSLAHTAQILQSNHTTSSMRAAKKTIAPCCSGLLPNMRSALRVLRCSAKLAAFRCQESSTPGHAVVSALPMNTRTVQTYRTVPDAVMKSWYGYCTVDLLITSVMKSWYSYEYEYFCYIGYGTVLVLQQQSDGVTCQAVSGTMSRA